MPIDVTSLTNRRACNRWDRVSIGDIFERNCWSAPDKEALVARPGAFAYPEYERLTYRQADQLANRVANALLGRGLARGDVVMMLCDNTVEAYVTKIGIAKAGLVCAPLNAMVAPDVMTYLIERMGASFAIVDSALWERGASGFEAAGRRADVTIEIGGGVVDGGESFASFVAGGADTEPEGIEIHGDDIWEVIFTSGTTAMPKASMVSHHSAHYAGYAMGLSLSRGLRNENDLRLCVYLPIVFHVTDQAFTIPTLLCGGTLVIGRGPEPAAIGQAIAEERCTAVWGGSPAMLNGLLAALEAGAAPGCDSLGIACYGWAALPPSTLAGLKRHYGEDLLVFEIFGQTESISCHRFWPHDHPDLYERTAPQHNYVGLPNPILASTIMDVDGVQLDSTPGVPGEVVYRSPCMTQGYYRDQESTEALFRYGWMHSGDACEWGEDGQRIMVDRFKDIVKSGGENVSSQRVEAALAQHPAVAAAAVVGLLHEHWGEAVTAFVVAADGASIDESALIEHCRARLAGFETPKQVVVLESLPSTVGGKILKYKLREQYASLYDADRSSV